MNPKVEKILKLPLYQRLIILGVVAAILVGCFVWFLWLPEYERLGELKQKNEQLQSEVVQKRRIADNLPKFKAEYAKLEEQLQQALTQLPNKSEIPTLLTNLATLAKDNGLDVVKFTPKKEVPKGFYAEVPTSLQLSGSYHDLALFAQAVGELSRIVNIGNLKLSGPKLEGDRAVLKIDCDVTTFRFLDK